MTKTYAGTASWAAALLLGVAAQAAAAAGPGTLSSPSAESLVTKVQGLREGGSSSGGSFGGGGGGAGRSGGVTSGGGGGAAIERGGDRGFASRSGRSEGGAARRSGDRTFGSGRWEGRGDHRGRHRYSRHRGLRIYLGPGYGYYDGDYDYSCEWLRRRAIQTGSSYWWRRFRDCVY